MSRKRYLTLSVHGPKGSEILSVNTWADEKHQGDLLDQADFPFAHIMGMRAREASDGHLEPGRHVVSVYLPGTSAEWRAEVDGDFWDDFNTALEYLR